MSVTTDDGWCRTGATNVEGCLTLYYLLCRRQNEWNIFHPCYGGQGDQFLRGSYITLISLSGGWSPQIVTSRRPSWMKMHVKCVFLLVTAMPPSGKPSCKKSAVFLNIVQKAFDPPPFYLNICPILQGVFFNVFWNGYEIYVAPHI